MLVTSLILTFGLAMANDDVRLSAQQTNDCRTREVQSDRDVPKETKDRLLAMCLENKKAEVRLENQRREISRIQRENGKCLDEQTTTVRRRFWFDSRRPATAADYAACAEKVTAAEARATQLEADLTRQSEALAAAERDLTGTATAATESAEAARRVRSVVRDEFKEMRLSVLDLLRQSDKGVAQLNKMAQAIDNSALGIYLRDRMASVMSSPAMCKAVSTCSSGNPTAIKGSDLNSAFDNDVTMKADEVSGAAVPRPPAAPRPPSTSTNQ